MELEIHTFKKWNSYIDFCPNRWGLITQVNLNWKDLLFLNEETFYDLEKNVRWGIPIMFPNAWPIKNDGKNLKLGFLKQHWFARNSIFSYEIKNNYFEMILNANDETKKIYNYDFELKIKWEILNDKEVKISKIIKNIWKFDMPISPWFHPYFFIKNEEKNTLDIFQENSWKINDYSFCDWETLILNNTWEIKVKSYFKLEFSNNYNNVWIRSEPWKDFVCIEPVYKNENALIEEPMIIKPWDEVTFSFILWIS